MIPKIAYFHWSQYGPEMSWLRWVSIQTFRKYNPDWDIRLIPTDPEVPGSLVYGQQADASWWLALERTGGFQVATDIVFLKPIPAEWLDCDLNTCFGIRGCDGVYQFAMLGCSEGNLWMKRIVEETRRRMAPGYLADYQDLGVNMLRYLDIWMKSLSGRIYQQPMSALCHVDHISFRDLWKDEEIPLPEEAIGVHWYGGGDVSRERGCTESPDSTSFLARLAREALNGQRQ